MLCCVARCYHCYLGQPRGLCCLFRGPGFRRHRSPGMGGETVDALRLAGKQLGQRRFLNDLWVLDGPGRCRTSSAFSACELRDLLYCQDVATGRWAEAASASGEGPAPRPGSADLAALERDSCLLQGLQRRWWGGSGRCSPRRSRPRVAGDLRRTSRMEQKPDSQTLCCADSLRRGVPGQRNLGTGSLGGWPGGRGHPWRGGEAKRSLQSRQLPAGSGESCKEAGADSAPDSASHLGQVPELKAERGGRAPDPDPGGQSCAKWPRCRPTPRFHHTQTVLRCSGGRGRTESLRVASHATSVIGISRSKCLGAFARPSTLAVVGGHNFMVRPGGSGPGPGGG